MLSNKKIEKVKITDVECENLVNVSQSNVSFSFENVEGKSDQVYSNTRVPTQVNANQHESTRINTSPTRINSSPTRVNTSQLDQETTIVYRSFSW